MASESSGIQSKLLPIMVIALIGSAFFLGRMMGKVEVYEKGTTTAGTGTAPAQAGQPTEAAQPEITQLSDDQWESILADPVYAMGDEDAAVTIVEMTDFQCPFCKRYNDDTFGQIRTEYVDTGKVRYLFRDFPLQFHANAAPASLAARCAADQGSYIEMHDVLFENQESWSNGDPTEAFKDYAGELGLNQASFDSCYDSGQFTEAVNDDLALAGEVGASGTPTFFINGTKLVGAQPFSAFQAAIEAEL